MDAVAGFLKTGDYHSAVSLIIESSELPADINTEADQLQSLHSPSLDSEDNNVNEIGKCDKKESSNNENSLLVSSVVDILEKIYISKLFCTARAIFDPRVSAHSPGRKEGGGERQRNQNMPFIRERRKSRGDKSDA